MTAPSEIKFRFNPSSSKSKKVLGPLECDIMDVVWDQGRTTVSAVHKALRDKRDLAYTTVMTTMSRLAKKNLLHQDTTASTYVYTPALSRLEFDHYVVMGVIRGLIDDYGDVVGDCFVECLNDGANLDKRRISAAICE